MLGCDESKITENADGADQKIPQRYSKSRKRKSAMRRAKCTLASMSMMMFCTSLLICDFIQAQVLIRSFGQACGFDEQIPNTMTVCSKDFFIGDTKYIRDDSGILVDELLKF